MRSDSHCARARRRLRQGPLNNGDDGAMTVIINGERREVPDGLNIVALLENIGITSDRVAIERNLDILPRAQWGETQVQPNDSFEIVHFVGGG
jgi:thiamine biosynthesis protein ThiS